MDATQPGERSKPTGRCGHCGRRTYGGATSCKSRICDRYAPLWAGDWRRVFFDNFGALRELVPQLPKGLEARAVMLAVTGPGKDPTFDPVTGEVICAGMPWDLRKCLHPAGEACSGRKGCKVDPVRATAWNVTADERWSRLHRRVATETRRRFGNDSLVLLARVKELQKRGLIHWHPVLLAATPKQREAVAWYRDRLGELAAQYGFGYVSMKLRPQSAKAAAAYLSSYFVTGKKEKAQLQESVQHPALRKGRLMWLTPRLTTKTGVTMRELRFRRYVWMRFGSFVALGGVWVNVARRLAELERDTGTELTGEQIGALLQRWCAGGVGDLAAQLAA